MATLSVIVPVYNVEKYLPTCLDSILKQSGFKLEIIIVDDGSTDDSSQICDEYSNRDSRIRVLHVPNSGVSSARNTGIACATGEYVAFVDSDDQIVNDAYQTCSTYLEEHPETDCLIYGYQVIKNKLTYSVIPKEGIYTKLNFGKAYTELQLKFLINSPCNKIYRREVISSSAALFPEDMALGEDLIFNNQYLRMCQRIKVLNKALYKYYHRDNGSLTTRFHEDLFTVYCKHFEDIKNTLAFYGISSIDSKILSCFYGYMKDAINMLIHPRCSLTLWQKYQEIDKILNHSYTREWIDFAKQKDLYWWPVKNQCRIGILMYIYGAELKGLFGK